ncbi:MAG: formate--phosphoribosylaminoimidazolecarboxamide ligase family protein [Candidatus Altiarchaeota archaeon]
MMDRRTIWKRLESYDTSKIRIGAIASHSALDIADGATEEGYTPVLYCQRGRERTYTRYFRTQKMGSQALRGCVGEYKVYERFSQLMQKREQQSMREDNVLFIPNRSFTSYIDINRIEKEFEVPIVGSRNLLTSEERGIKKDYYWLLKKADMPYPKQIKKPEQINKLAIVKLHHAKKRLERGFFTAASYEEYLEKSNQLVKQGVITKNDLKNARIEEYVIGPVFNLDFFYSPIEDEMEKLELLGVDWRFETSLDGHVRLPAPQQMTMRGAQKIPEYTVCGHNSATLRESLLDNAFELGERYVKATQKHYEPGIIGAFCLQTCVDKDLKFHIYDVAPRIGGGTNVHVSVGHPYGNALWRKPMSSGRRTALEVRRAVSRNRLGEIVT